jgi:hypothetical protein
MLGSLRQWQGLTYVLPLQRLLLALPFAATVVMPMPAGSASPVLPHTQYSLALPVLLAVGRLFDTTVAPCYLMMRRRFAPWLMTGAVGQSRSSESVQSGVLFAHSAKLLRIHSERREPASATDRPGPGLRRRKRAAGG